MLAQAIKPTIKSLRQYFILSNSGWKCAFQQQFCKSISSFAEHVQRVQKKYDTKKLRACNSLQRNIFPNSCLMVFLLHLLFCEFFGSREPFIYLLRYANCIARMAFWGVMLKSGIFCYSYQK